MELFYNFAVKRIKRMVPAWRISGAIALRAALRRELRAELASAWLSTRPI